MRFVLWPNDHPPPHVHVFAENAEAKIALGGAGRLPQLLENRRMGRADLARALAVTLAEQQTFIDRWNALHV